MNKTELNKIYTVYNKRCYVHPDPLECLYNYDEIRDREIAALVASSLAYGRVAQILKSVSHVLNAMGESPYSFILNETYSSLADLFKGFRHRFASGEHLAALLIGMQSVIRRFGSLNECFTSGMVEGKKSIVPGMSFFVRNLTSHQYTCGHLLADPAKGSACKRMNLFLRWMVRKDRVDPGGWRGIDKSSLVIPLDTHMHLIGRCLGFSSRNQANMKTALEITEGFKAFTPKDPLKYDFALTRFGIRNDLDMASLFARKR